MRLRAILGLALGYAVLLAIVSLEVPLAISLRNQANLAQRCPVCGAHGLNREQRRRLKRECRGQVGIAAMVHDDDCPVSDDAIHAMFVRKGVQL